MVALYECVRNMDDEKNDVLRNIIKTEMVEVRDAQSVF